MEREVDGQRGTANLEVVARGEHKEMGERKEKETKRRCLKDIEMGKKSISRQKR